MNLDIVAHIQKENIEELTKDLEDVYIWFARELDHNDPKKDYHTLQTLEKIKRVNFFLDGLGVELVDTAKRLEEKRYFRERKG